MLQSGETIGAYRVIRLLGKGGMGAVYEVEHLELGTRGALKVFAREHGDVASMRRRFRTEGMALARLRHPNLLRVYDLGEDEKKGVLYFAMDLALGVTFYRLLTGIWYEPGTVADGLLAEFGDEWSKALRQLLSDDPAARLPIPSVAASRSSTKRGRYIVVALAVVAALAITGAFLCLVGGDHRAPRDAEDSAPVGTAFHRRPPKAANYNFDHFFPLHKED